jgi:hypothetical protein
MAHRLWTFLQTEKARGAGAIFIFFASLWMGAEMSIHPVLVIIAVVGCIAGPLILFAPEIARLKVVYDERTRNESPVWLYLYAIATIGVVAVLGVGLYRSAALPQPLTFDDELQTYMHDRSVYVTDLVRTEPIVHDKIFENVTFVGPAVVAFPEGDTISYNTVNGGGAPVDAVFTDVTGHPQSIGAVIFRDCVIKHCRFQRIQIVGDTATINQFKKSMENLPKQP